ncbi:MAG TPA: exodeoxyribonuclease VII large subunit [Spirochaetia bacterium]|nr:exodeoxyribonuclease VII large subunit [Spirochaetia bacterium]
MMERPEDRRNPRAAPADGKHFTVSEITELIKATLEESFPWITVQGEISNFRPSSSGHWYFSLKDVNAVLSAVMFHSRLETVKFTPGDGMLVTASGSISVYQRRGSYQLICESLIRAGQGDILAMLEERKRSLAAEGLFDAARKRPLPVFPSRVAVVTSPTGAAIRDILRVLRRRNAGIDVVIVPTPVQGEGADERIAHAIETTARWRLGEVIIVGRGGGSLEDLLPFSSEAVVRAIAASPVPVISAVGHETDVTLSDLAADVRAPTPSAAAEIVAASRSELLAQVAGLKASLEGSLQSRLDMIRVLLGQFSRENLERNVRLFLQPTLQRLDDATEALRRGFSEILSDARHRFELAARELSSYSPLAVLERGYAVVTHEPTRRVLVSADGVHPRDRLDIRLARGGLRASVEEMHAGEKL